MAVSQYLTLMGICWNPLIQGHMLGCHWVGLVEVALDAAIEVIFVDGH